MYSSANDRKSEASLGRRQGEGGRAHSCRRRNLCGGWLFLRTVRNIRQRKDLVIIIDTTIGRLFPLTNTVTTNFHDGDRPFLEKT